MVQRILACVMVIGVLASAGVLWWISDAALARSHSNGLNPFGAESMEAIGWAMRWYLLPCLGALALLAIVQAVLAFRRPTEFGPRG